MTVVELVENGPAVEVALSRRDGTALADSGLVVAAPTTTEGWWTVSPASTVGVARVGGVELWVAPKLPIRRLLFLLGFARNAKGWRDEDIGMLQAPNLLVAVAEAFTRQANRALAQGLLQGYRSVDEALPVVRGRLREADQLRRRHGIPVPLEVRYDDFTVDIAENQLLRAASERLLRLPGRYTGPDTKWHNAPTTFDTRIDSEAWLADERRLIASGAWRPPTDRAAARARAEEARRLSTFGVYADAWFKGRHDLRPATRTSYRTSIGLHLKPTFGDLPLSEITAAQVRSWFASYGDRTPTARAHAYQVLSAILAQAEDDDLVQRNPCRIRSGGKVSVQREPEVLGLAELLALADAMPEQHRALTLICGFGGLRFGEVAGLRLRDVDLTHGVLRV